MTELLLGAAAGLLAALIAVLGARSVRSRQQQARREETVAAKLAEARAAEITAEASSDSRAAQTADLIVTTTGEVVRLVRQENELLVRRVAMLEAQVESIPELVARAEQAEQAERRCLAEVQELRERVRRLEAG